MEINGNALSEMSSFYYLCIIYYFDRPSFFCISLYKEGEKCNRKEERIH